MTTYTLIISSPLLIACIPDGSDIEGAICAEERNARIEVARDELIIETGLTLTDDEELLAHGRVIYSGDYFGYLTDEAGVTYQYAVRLP